MVSCDAALEARAPTSPSSSPLGRGGRRAARPGRLVVLQSPASGHDQGLLILHPRARQPAHRRSRLLRRLRPRAGRPRQRAAGRCTRRPGRTSMTPVRTALLFEQMPTIIPCGSPRVADEALRGHVSPGDIALRKRARAHVPAARRVRLRSHRRGRDQAVRLPTPLSRPRARRRLHPGVPHFLTYRLRECGFETHMIDAAHEMNTTMPDSSPSSSRPGAERSPQGHRARRAHPALGVAYKPKRVRPARVAGARDLRGAAAARRPARLRADPHVASAHPSRLRLLGTRYRNEAIVASADVVVMLSRTTSS